MKKNVRVLMIIVIIMLALFGAGLTGYVIGIKDSGIVENLDNNDLEDKDEPLSGEKEVIFDKLFQYGKEIYDKELYLSFDKDVNDVYYASLSVLDNLGYDITIIDTNCSDNNPIIFFDVEFKLVSDYQGIPLMINVDCNS